jgi:hypothetical protein
VTKIPDRWLEYFGAEIAFLMYLQVKALESIDKPVRFPASERALRESLKNIQPSKDVARWVVRQVALHGGPIATAGVFAIEAHANEFAAFWGTFVHTEVRVVKIEAGVDAYAEHLDDWERMWSRKKRVPSDFDRPSFINDSGCAPPTYGQTLPYPPRPRPSPRLQRPERRPPPRMSNRFLPH